MADPPTIESLRSSVLSAKALRELQPEWSDAVIDEWLNFLDNFITLANVIDVEIDQKIEDVPTDFADGSIPFADDGFLVEANSKLFWDVTNFILKITGTIQSQGRIKGDVVVTPSMSPYTVNRTDETVFADTNTGDIILNLPSGLDGDALRISNTGTSGNKATMVPSGTELLYGVNDSEFLIDLEHLDMQYEITLGWN